MRKLPFFTHIPKTAGTAVRKQLLYPNIPVNRRGESRGYWELLRKEWSDCWWLEGHFPYGIHRYMRGLPGKPIYFTMLRDPLEQAISYYYFIHSCSTQPDSSYKHPLYDQARRFDLVDFYAQPEHQNIQTRFLAGCLWDRLRNHRLLSVIDHSLLATAKEHLLNRYSCFGLVSNFEISLRMFGRLFGWEVNIPDRKVKKTRDRPAVEDLARASRRTLREHLHLDVALYEFANCHFSRQDRFSELASHSQ